MSIERSQPGPRHASARVVVLVAAALAGGSLAVAFSPWSWWWFAPLPLAVLFRLAHATRPRNALALGYAFGLGLFGVGISWVHVSMAQFGAGGALTAIAATAALVATLAVFPAMALGLTRLLSPRSRLLELLVVAPACWVLLEWSRTWALTGFPWLLVGYSQTGSAIGRAVAPVLGVLGVSLVVALVAGGLAYGVTEHRRGRRVVAPVTVAASMLPLAALTQVAWTEPAGPPIDVALVQGNVDQAEKWRPENLDAILARYERLSEATWGRSLVVWPETAIPARYDRVNETFLPRLAARARRVGTTLITGLPSHKDGQIYNSAIAVDRGPVYHKRHLVPFGEYVPFRSFFGSALDLLGAPMSDFTAGSRATLLPAAGYRAGVAICYEIAFGNEVAAFFPGANVIVNISNDAWFGESIGPWQHLQIARMRAIEFGRYVLRATNTGVTAIIDPEGAIVARAPQFEAAVVEARVSPRSGLTPYARWTDAPILGAIGVALLPFLLMRLIGYTSCRWRGAPAGRISSG